MGIIKNEKRPWLDEEPEMMEKIPPIEERVACCWLRRLKATPIRIVLIIIGVLPILLFFEGGRHGWRYSSIHNGIFPIIEVSKAWKAGGVVFFFAIFALINFLGRNEKGHVDIYPEMMVFYAYDLDKKEARPTRFYYWKDIVQYHRKEPYLWLYSRDNLPVGTVISIKKLRPYLRQYAPHAKEADFSMKEYWKIRI